ncbi:hypothetical protein OG601_09785 [Streptomyces sp. NBC_01239]|uniref:hypothetical protein n=1 Tax=Streptomyces sp. NBC_01239 TaxID=2903792 RepID=UPI00225361A4|nr:hypothetical protein [Streptomyces sp. NBC_01239]MCX4810910.1 hypothetical protein [Streptomyces sp. NBC_01239]
MTTAPDPTSAHAWNLVHAPFTATTWRRTAYALLALPLGLACIPLALLGAPTARWQRGLVRRFLGADRADPTDLPGRPRAGGLPHALLAAPLNLVTAFITLYGWSIVPLNIGWPLRAGDDYSDAWGGPTFAGAWAFHAVVGGIGFLLLMPWMVRGLTAVQFRVARSLLS